nr:AlpA family phage regulatory protein [Rhodospirillales bacterium]
MNFLPETGFIRVSQIIGDVHANPPIPPIFPVSKSTWWAGVKSGRFPKPVKLGVRTTAWRVCDIRELLASFDNMGGES